MNYTRYIVYPYSIITESGDTETAGCQIEPAYKEPFLAVSNIDSKLDGYSPVIINRDLKIPTDGFPTFAVTTSGIYVRGSINDVYHDLTGRNTLNKLEAPYSLVQYKNVTDAQILNIKTPDTAYGIIVNIYNGEITFKGPARANTAGPVSIGPRPELTSTLSGLKNKFVAR